MANRPIFIPSIEGPQYVNQVSIEFEWIPGMAKSQKKKNVLSLHASAKENGYEKILEVSTKSQLPLGEELSAFNLILSIPILGSITVESAFQGSKVFQSGGPYRDFYQMGGREIKRDERLRKSGDLLHFDLMGEVWKLIPKTSFYDYIYLSALTQNPKLSEAIIIYEGFTDIEFNPKKSINCQARSAALYVSLFKRKLLEEALKSKGSYIEILTAFQQEYYDVQMNLL